MENERLEALQVSAVAASIAASMAEKRLAPLLKEVEDTLKIVEAKRTLKIRLTQEERAFWTLFGKKKR